MEEDNESSVRQKSAIKAERQAVQGDGETSDAVRDGGGDRDKKAGEQMEVVEMKMLRSGENNNG